MPDFDPLGKFYRQQHLAIRNFFERYFQLFNRDFSIIVNSIGTDFEFNV